ncbi:MAG: amino acid ABC transporter permease, partial [Haliea sp.]
MPPSDSPLIPPRPPARRAFSWRSRQARGVIYQVLAVAVIALLAWLLISNTLTNMRLRGI